MRGTSTVRERLKSVPLSPGVYLFRDTEEKVLYVGKAAVLRHRLRSYFGPPARLEPKIQRMVGRIAEFEYIVTSSESEALILECTLIKQHRPPFNARLKDDKSYPYIKIDPSEPFPQVHFTRRLQPDGARYFGPYASASSVRRTMDLLKKLFPYRSCTKPITGTDPRPCLEFYINRCVAPCTGSASQAEYRQVINQVILFLEGRTEPVVRDLRRHMAQAAQGLEYERAAILRDQIQAIERVAEEQRVAAVRQEDADVLGVATDGDMAWVELFPVRRGKVVGRERFVMEGTQDESPGQVLADFVKQFYDAVTFIPPTLLLQHPLEDSTAIELWLRQKRGGRVQVRVPRRGEKAKLLQLAAQNASQGVEERRARWIADADAMEAALAELQEELSLPRLPDRIECYDISNVRGAHAVGSMVVLLHGKPSPPHYRRFQIKQVEGIDDYAMMQEMLRRRFKRLGSSTRQDGATDAGRGGDTRPEERESAWGIIPDLVLIDGGKGHLSAALQVFLEMGVDSIPLASLAKENEELFVPHMTEAVILPRNSPALFLAQRARDEAHRFAISYHRKLRSKASIRSAMDDIPGIGPHRKRLLLRKFGTVSAIRQASLEDLASTPGMTRTLAQKVKDYL